MTKKLQLITLCKDDMGCKGGNIKGDNDIILLFQHVAMMSMSS